MRDKFGIGLSFFCLVHCISMPLIVNIFPLLLNLDHLIEIPILLLTFVVGLTSFWKNITKHKYFLSALFFVFGFFLIFVSMLFHLHWLNFISLPTLIVAHFLNWKKIKQLDGCHPHNCKH
jgi:hypothetical protein